MKFVQAKGWLSSNMGDELLMMSIDDGNYLSISRIGMRIYEMLATPATIEEVCAGLVEDYEIEPEACRAETEAFIDDMIARGAILQVP